MVATEQTWLHFLKIFSSTFCASSISKFYVAKREKGERSGAIIKIAFSNVKHVWTNIFRGETR